MRIFKAFLTIFFLSLIAFLPAKIFAATDFQIDDKLEISYEYGQEYVSVRERIDYYVENPDYFYNAGTVQHIFIPDISSKDAKKEREFIKDSLEIKTLYDSPIRYTVKDQEEGLDISVTIDEKITTYNDYSLVVSYNTHDFVSLNGNIVNLYIPGLSPEIPFTQTDSKYGLVTTYNYDAELYVSTDSPKASFIQPEGIREKEENNWRVYTFDQEDRLGHTGWIQLGSSQYYYFKLEQVTPKTDNITPQGISGISDLISTNIYKIALPREFDETQQQVYIKSITPEPKGMERDDDGNLFALFEVPANEVSKIVVEGYISLYKSAIKEQKPLPTFSLSGYFKKIESLPGLEEYISPDKYWEINDPNIIEIAETVGEGKFDLWSLLLADYQYVVDQFTYSTEKLEQGNPRLGASKALSGSQTICMEYSDALTAILRAQGIPARVAIGYGNDPTGAENRISNTEPVKQTIGHQWVQVWIPDYGWLSLDPTWGESERRYIGTDLDHILWYAVSKDSDNITDTLLYSADSISSSELTNYSLYLQALTEDQFNDQQGIEKISQVMLTYAANNEGLSFAIKTTPLGRIFVFLIPAIFTVIVVSGIVGLSKKAMQRIRTAR